MFTGIVEEVGKVTAIKIERGTHRLTVATTNLVPNLKQR